MASGSERIKVYSLYYYYYYYYEFFFINNICIIISAACYFSCLYLFLCLNFFKVISRLIKSFILMIFFVVLMNGNYQRLTLNDHGNLRSRGD